MYVVAESVAAAVAGFCEFVGPSGALTREVDWVDGVVWIAARFEGPLNLPRELVGVAA